MTTNCKIARPLFALGAALIAAPLAAAEPMVVTGEPQPVYQERVSFADLDLRQRPEQQTLYRRVRQASDRVCDLTEGRFNIESQHGQRFTCAYQTAWRARPQIVAAIRRAGAGQLQATALIIAGPANARR